MVPSPRPWRSRASDPEPGQRQCGPGIDDPGRDPHQQSSELLVLQRRQPPFRSSHGLRGIERPPRNGEQYAEKAGVKRCREEIKHGGTVSLFPALQERPPEQERGAEESDVLK